MMNCSQFNWESWKTDKIMQKKVVCKSVSFILQLSDVGLAWNFNWVRLDPTHGPPFSSGIYNIRH